MLYISDTFAYTDGFHGDIGAWDTSRVVNMRTTFSYSNAFSDDVSQWDTSRLLYMYRTFHYATIDLDLAGWDTSSVTDMYGAFSYSTFNRELPWDTSSVHNLLETFRSASKFNGNIQFWDTSRVTTLRRKQIPLTPIIYILSSTLTNISNEPLYMYILI